MLSRYQQESRIKTVCKICDRHEVQSCLPHRDTCDGRSIILFYNLRCVHDQNHVATDVERWLH